MIRTLGPFLCVAALLAGPHAWAETWVVIAQGAGATLSLDKESVSSSAGRTLYVSRLLYSTPQTLTKEAEAPATYTELRHHMQMDCTNKLQSPLTGRFFDASGKMVAEIVVPERLRPIIAGSSADWEFRVVCPGITPEPQTDLPTLGKALP